MFSYSRTVGDENFDNSERYECIDCIFQQVRDVFTNSLIDESNSKLLDFTQQAQETDEFVLHTKSQSDTEAG